ncbi:Putative protein of unknown function [Podospora comata]|uniref:Pentatricopeptide repeat-containing protein n=1 Tax=Podospora comata TaxID=48703 RepID=A0ABY6S197_PODCO|nr:Putative protein of unknown function [Podospora comata]
MILRAGLVGRSCLARACQRRSQIPLIHPLLPPPPISHTSRVQRSEQLLAQLARDAPFTTTTRLSFQSDDSDIIPPWEKPLGKVDSHMSPDDMEETAKANPDRANNVSETSPETTPVPSSLGPEEIERNYASTAEPGVASHTFNAADRDNQVPQLEPYRFAERGGKLAWGPGHRGNWLDSWEARFRPLYRALKSGRAYSRMLADVEDFPDWGKTEMLFEAAEIEQGEFKERHCGFGNVDEYMAKWMDSMLYLLRYDPELAPKFLRATFEGFLTPRWAVNDTAEFLAKWCSLSRSSKKTTHELAETICHILRTRTLYMLEFTQQTLFLLTRDMEAEALWNLYRDLLQYSHPLHPYTWYTIARRLSRDPRYKSRALDLLEEAITSGELHSDAPLTMMLSTCILDFQGVEDGHLEQSGRLRRELTTRLLNLITPNKYTYSVMVRGMRATGDYQGAWTIYQIMIDQGIEPEQFIFSNLLNVAKRTNTIEPVLQTLEELVPEALKSRHIWNDIIDSVLVISRQHDLQLKEEGQRNAHAALTFRALLLVYARFYRYKELQSLIPVRLGPPYETKEQVFATATSDMDVVFLRKIDLILERLPERVEKPAVPGSDVISIMLRGYTRAVWKAGEVISFYKRLRAKLMQGQYTMCQICREQDSRVHDAILGSLLKIPKWNNVAWAPAENSKRAAESRDALQAGFGILEDMIEGAMCAERVLKEEEEEELLAKRMADDDSPADEEAVRTIESVLPSQEDAVLSEQEPLLIERGDGLPTEDSAAQDIMTEEHILVEHPPPEEEHRPAEEDYLPPSEENLPTKDYLSPSEENLSTEVNLPTKENLPAQDGLPVKDDLPVEEQYLPAEEDLQPTEDEAQEEPLLTTDQPQEPTEPPPLSEPSKPSPPEQPRQSAPSPQQLLPLLDPDLVTPLHPAPRPGAGWPSFKAQQAQWAAFHKDETYLYSMSPAPTIYTFNILLSGVIRASRSITNVKDCIKQAEDWIKYLADHNLQPNYHTWAILVRNWSRQQRPGAVAWAMKKMEEAGFRANNKMMEELQLLRDKERAWRELERLMEEDLGREKEGGGKGWEREEGWDRLGRIVKEQEERRRKLEFELVVEDEMYGNEVYRDGRGGEKEESDWDMFVKRVEEDRKGEEREKREGGGGEGDVLKK